MAQVTPGLGVSFTETGALQLQCLCLNPGSTPSQLCVDPCLNPSGPHFPYLENGLNNIPNLIGVTENQL